LRFARERNKATDTDIDWANWQPGDRAAALVLRPPDAFKKLLASQGITFKEFSDTTIRDIGNAVGEAIELGLPAQRSAKRIKDHVASASRALSIAITEQNRAISFATVNRYKEAGLEKMEWEVSSPCDKCAQNANQVVAIGGTFNSGATQPPQHPHCRCVLLPVLPDFEDPAYTGGTITAPAPIVETPKPPKPTRTDKDVIDEALIAARAAQNDVFTPGQWRKLTPDEIKEDVITEYLKNYNMMAREQVIDWIDRGKFGKATTSLITKGTVYKNGNIQVQFHSGGTSVPDKVKKEIVEHVEKLQIANPNEKVTVTIGQSKKNAYGWATLGGDGIWLAPKTAKTVVPNLLEGGKFKMPALLDNAQWKYTLTHEWGHHIDEGSSFFGQTAERTFAIQRLKTAYPDAFKSLYSMEKPEEFFAEMFAEWFLTNGTTTNQLVQAMAKEFNWKL
jgi:hypothetical protein